ncbi:MAG TPA: hypothetical protein VHD90_04410 [Phototrophicaceae bacterium]|nr:hypothetical protein [Phototrophicaceae bacterium]
MPSCERLPAGMLIACLLLTVAALLIGHVLPAASTDSALDQNTCALPCFFGVTLGTTSFDQAIEAVQNSGHPPQIGDTLISFPLTDVQERSASAAINFDGNGRAVSARLIPIDAFADIGQMSDLVLIDSTPTRVFRTCDQVVPVRFLLIFDTQNQLIMAEALPLASDLAPDTPLTFFEATTDGNSALYDEQSSFGCSVEIRWIGFAPLWKYFRLNPLD